MLTFSHPVKIIMVENEHLIAGQTTQLLMARGHEITYCGFDGHALLAAVERAPPDLILTGFYLKGDMPGPELVDRLRTRWNIPIVVLSGAPAEDLPLAWQDKPGLFFLGKPFLPNQLHLIIEQALNQPGTSQWPSPSPDSIFFKP